MDSQVQWHRGDEGYEDDPRRGYFKRKDKQRGMAHALRKGRLRPVSAAPQSFRALTHPSFSERSGTSPETSPDVAFSKKKRRRLWDELVELTGAEWPEPDASRERQKLAAPGEGQDALQIGWGMADEDSFGSKARPGLDVPKVEKSEMERGPMRLGSYTPGLRGSRLPKKNPPGLRAENGTVLRIPGEDEIAFIKPDVPNDGGLDVFLEPEDCTGYNFELPPDGTRVQFISMIVREMIPVGDIEDYIKKRFRSEQVAPIGTPIVQPPPVGGPGSGFRYKIANEPQEPDEIWAVEEELDIDDDSPYSDKNVLKRFPATSNT